TTSSSPRPTTDTPSLTLLPYTHPPTPQLYTLSLHDALPICPMDKPARPRPKGTRALLALLFAVLALIAGYWGWREFRPGMSARTDRKSTRLNSSHLVISYAVFCLKKKT